MKGADGEWGMQAQEQRWFSKNLSDFITSTTVCASATPRQNPTQEGVHSTEKNNKGVLPKKYHLN